MSSVATISSVKLRASWCIELVGFQKVCRNERELFSALVPDPKHLRVLRRCGGFFKLGQHANCAFAITLDTLRGHPLTVFPDKYVNELASADRIRFERLNIFALDVSALRLRKVEV